MIFVITEPCVGVKDASCVEVCPVNCIYEGPDQYYINPDECIGCSLCVTVCPVEAIYDEDDVPEQWKHYIEKNRAFFQNQ
ncbi:MAG: 4Fe-4S binding protein [Clostridiales bacterium]|nr:4Fe-4S binding protein [Clostridiales bacterium]